MNEPNTTAVKKKNKFAEVWKRLCKNTGAVIGMGVQAPTPEWGAMISEAREFYRQKPYLVIFPGVCIILTALSFNLIGDGLRDALDPRLRD